MGAFRTSGTMYGLYIPCKECNMRYVGCHSKCDYYLEYKKALEEIKAKREKDREIMNLMSERYRGHHRPTHVTAAYKQSRGG